MEVELLCADPQLACACRVTLLRTVFLQPLQASGFSLLFMLFRRTACTGQTSLLFVGWTSDVGVPKRRGAQRQPAVRVTPHCQAIPLYNRNKPGLPKNLQHHHTVAVPPKHESIAYGHVGRVVECSTEGASPGMVPIPPCCPDVDGTTHHIRIAHHQHKVDKPIFHLPSVPARRRAGWYVSLVV